MLLHSQWDTLQRMLGRICTGLSRIAIIILMLINKDGEITFKVTLIKIVSLVTTLLITGSTQWCVILLGLLGKQRPGGYLGLTLSSRNTVGN